MRKETGQMNTTKSGAVRCIVFKEGDTWYGVALEFNIVESGTDPREVMLLLDEAMRGYVKGAQKARLSASVLNQETDPEYEKLWNQIASKKPIKSPLKIYSYASVMVPIKPCKSIDVDRVFCVPESCVLRSGTSNQTAAVVTAR